MLHWDNIFATTTPNPMGFFRSIITYAAFKWLWYGTFYPSSLQLRHNERVSISNHGRLECLLNHLFRRRSKKISELCVTGLCGGNPPVTSGFLPQKARNAGNVSIRWRHHVFLLGNLLFPPSFGEPMCKDTRSMVQLFKAMLSLQWRI